MVVFDISNPPAILLLTIVTGLLLFLSHEIKKSLISAGVLFVHLMLLVMHCIQTTILHPSFLDLKPLISRCIFIDFIFVLVTFFTYLKVDELEAKAQGKRSINDISLDWFWKKKNSK